MPDLAGAIRSVAPSANLPVTGAGKASVLPGDSVATLLRELSEADLTRLLEIVDRAPTASQQEQVRVLLQSAAEAVAEQNPARALEQLRQLIHIDPVLGVSLRSELSLDPIRSKVEQLLYQLTESARTHAEGRLAEATQRMDTQTAAHSALGDVRPEIFLLVAAGLMEAGGLANYVRSAALSDAYIDQGRWVPSDQAELVSEGTPYSERRIRFRWIVSAWFAVGMASAAGCWWLQYDGLRTVFEVWSGGLLVLACAGAWQRMRRS